MLSVSNEKNGTSYSFNKINKGVPLFINDRAVLFAFGSKGYDFCKIIFRICVLLKQKMLEIIFLTNKKGTSFKVPINHF